METTIMALSIDPRTEHAPQVQTVLTKHGCIIKTRIGMHEATSKSCSERGLIILHINSDEENVKQLERELKEVEGVSVKSMTI